MAGFPERLNLAAHVLDARVAEGHGDRVALRVGDVAVTYAALLDEANRVANVLAALGLGRGDRVLVALPDGVPFVAAFLATLKVGAAVTMANPELPPGDYAAHLAYTRAKVLVDDRRDVGDLHAAVPALLGVDDDRRAARALVEAARGVRADAALEPALVQEPLELVLERLTALRGAVALGVPRLAPVRADEDVPVEVGLGHGTSRYSVRGG